MSTNIDKIKAEIKEWQRTYRRAHGRDPGKDELKKNPEMQAKYKIWQDSLKSSKVSSRKQDDEASTPPRPSRSLIPKTLPVQSASKGPTTPFSARKKQVARKPSSSSDERVPAPDLSSAKRGTSSQSSRVIPFNSASKSQTRIFPSLLASDSDDDNPFAAPDPVSPSRSRRTSPHKPLESPSKSNLLRTPSKPKPRSTSPESQPFLTPRTKARKRMRGEEVPATPGDKRRKLGAARSILPTQDEQDEEDEDEIVDSPKKKRATAVNGRVFTGLFDDDGAGGSTKGREVRPEDVSSVMDETSSLRSTPPPPPSEPDHDWTSTQSHSDEDEDEAPTTRPKARPVLPTLGKWTQDTWDAPAPGTDFSHLRKGLGKPLPEPTKRKAKEKEKEKQSSGLAVSNPFDLLPPMPEEQPASSKSRYDNNKSKASVKGKKGKDKDKEPEMDDGESSDGNGGMDVNEIEWRPFGPLMGSQNQRSDSQTPFSSQTQRPALASQPQLLDDEPEPDPAATLPSDLRSLLSLHSTHREFIRSDSLAKDILAGRSTSARGGEVWGVGDMEEEEEGEGDDWDSEPEGWKGGVEM
ncbi:unnamed protein product [Rhizoctonia solani]|uniref:DNA replication regulator SLD2 n=1 Tax=Rhizoctonia solani TaxID=456999 RepID=A0A8H3GSP5_9AGAM|nr:unnamed protein product [Rhizoctonia solani]